MANATRQGMTPQEMIQQNQGLRMALLQSAPRMRKNLGAFTQGGNPSGTTRIKLFNVGIITKIVLDVVGSLDIATTIATPSPKAPFNLINRIKLTDYDSTDRVNCSGYQLWVLQCIRNQTAYGYNNESQTAVLLSPQVPTAIAANGVIRFQLEIPLAFDAEKDLRGALLAQTAVGEAYVNIDWNSLLTSAGNADAVYNTATGTVVQSSGTFFTVNVFQEYLLPQNVGNQVPIPVLDMMTVYEIAGAIRTSDNIAANQEKIINYPNLRSVIGFYANFINNGVMNAAQTDMTRFKLIANGNNVLREYNPTDKLFDQRRWMIADCDLRVGTYFEMHRTKPIETALYGNVQYSLTPSSVSGTNTNFEICFESFYTKGSQLPGLSQGS
jgi:hypothetical protein